MMNQTENSQPVSIEGRWVHSESFEGDVKRIIINSQYTFSKEKGTLMVVDNLYGYDEFQFTYRIDSGVLFIQCVGCISEAEVGCPFELNDNTLTIHTIGRAQRFRRMR